MQRAPKIQKVIYRGLFEYSLLLLASFFGAASGLAEPLPLAVSYSGRLTDAGGAPLTGPIDIQVRFWSAASDGNQLGRLHEYPGAELKTGVFQIEIAFEESELSEVFGNGDQRIYVEVSTNGRTYPRQAFSYVPLALRVPVDGQTLQFASGKMRVAVPPRTDLNSFLTVNAAGAFAWEVPNATRLQSHGIAPDAPSTGQVLSFANGQWRPSNLTNLMPTPAEISITAGAGLTGGTITNSGTISLANTAVSAGTYTRATITVDAQGRITAAQNGSPTPLNADVSGVLSVSNGGTGVDAMVNNGVLVGAGSLPVGAVTGEEHQVLTINASGAPVFKLIDLSTINGLTGILPVSKGGTGADLSASGGAGQYLKQTTQGGQLTVGSLVRSDVTEAIGYEPLSKSGDTLQGDLSLNNHLLSGIAAPVSGTDAVNKDYVDALTNQTFVVSNTGASSPSWSTTGQNHNLTLPLASATGVTAGLLSNEDYARFSDKFSSIDAGTGVAVQNTGGTATIGLASVSTAGTYTKVRTDEYGRVLGGTDLSTEDLTAALGYVPLNKAGDTLEGDVNYNGHDINGAGNIRMSGSKTLTLSAHNTDPTGLTADDKGKTWFNEATGQIKYFDGSVTRALEAAGLSIQTFNNQTGSNQTLATPGTIGTAPNWSSGGNVHTLHIPLASTSAVSAGLISNSDYQFFANKIGSVSSGTGIAVSLSSGTANVSLATTGTAGTYTKITTDEYGRVIASGTLSPSDIPPLSAASITSGTLDVARGGTGATTLATNSVLIGNGSSALQTIAPGTSGNVLTSNGTTWISTALPATNWAAPGAIGATTPSSGAFTSITSNAQIGHELKPFGLSTGNTAEIRFDELAANGTNYVGFKSPDLLAANKIWVLPAADGTAGQVLKTDGTGNLGWVSAATGTVTNVTGTAPISVATGATTPAISITQANATTHGYLSSADWTTFNGKQNAGNYITHLTGDMTLSGFASGTATATLQSVALQGTSTKVTYDVKGRILSGTSLSSADIPSLSAAIITSGTLTVANGGTGATSLAANNVILGNGTSPVQVVAPGTSGNVLTSNGSTWQSTALPATTWATPGTIGSTTPNTGAFTSVTSNAQAGFEAKPFGNAAGNTGEVRFDELAANGANYVGFKSPDLLTANKIWVLPAADGTAGQVLKTDGTGNLGWVSTATGTVTSVGITAPAAGITVTGGPVTSSGTMTMALSNDLAAVEGLAGTGGVERTAADSWATYTLTTAGKALLDDADATAQRATLGLAALATATAVSGGSGGTITDGTITNADIATTAAIVDSKLATITTAGKVSGTAITSGNITTSGAVASSAQGAFEAKPFSTAAGNTSEVRFDELAANGTNYVGFKSPDLLAANKIWVLPAADGTAGQVLKTDGTGNLGWVSPTAGTVTNVTGSAPISVATGTTTPAISITQANATTNGYLSSTDWTTFNSKLAGGTVAVANGGTGATTLTANNVLLGNGVNTLQTVAPGTSGNVLTSNGTTWASTALPATNWAAPGAIGSTTANSGAFTTITSTGNVGVGTSTTTEKLTVNGNIKAGSDWMMGSRMGAGFRIELKQVAFTCAANTWCVVSATWDRAFGTTPYCFVAYHVTSAGGSIIYTAAASTGMGPTTTGCKQSFYADSNGWTGNVQFMGIGQ